MVVDGNGWLETLRALTEAVAADGIHICTQINHPGRQTPIHINPHPVAPSAAALDLGEAAPGHMRFGAPTPWRTTR